MTFTVIKYKIKYNLLKGFLEKPTSSFISFLTNIHFQKDTCLKLLEFEYISQAQNKYGSSLTINFITSYCQ